MSAMADITSSTKGLKRPKGCSFKHNATESSDSNFILIKWRFDEVQHVV